MSPFDGRITLVSPFSFGNENITLKPNEWTIMAILLLYLYVSLAVVDDCPRSSVSRLTFKLPSLTSHLSESKVTQSLLTTLNLSPDMILQTINYLLAHPIGSHTPSLASATNFEDVD